MRADLENELFDEDKTTEKSWKNPGIWQRGLAMLCFGFISGFNQFLTINSETYPFPFTDWPDGRTSRVPPSEHV